MGKGKFSFGNRRDPDPEKILTPSPEEPEWMDDLPLGEEETPEEAVSPAEPLPEVPGEETQPLPSEDDDFQDAADEEIPSEEPEPERTPVRGSRTGTLIFYTLYILFVLGFVVAMFSATRRLNEWLTDYQLSQPTDQRDQIFADLFVDPDWAAVYDAAGIEDTAFESKDAFVTYMENLVGDRELTWVETSTGLSGNKKYFVKLGEESIASFLLVSEADPITGLPRWELGGLEAYFLRNQSVTIQIQEGQTAYVNGVALDESFTVRMDATLASRYLPTGIYPHRSYTQQLSGLLIEPEITVRDEDGLAVTVTYDEEQDLYFTDGPVYPDEAPELCEQAVIQAAEAYSSYLLGEEGAEDKLDEHFDRTADASRYILRAGPFDQEDFRYEFLEETITNFRQYAEDLFSVRLRLSFRVTESEEETDPDAKTKETEPTDEDPAEEFVLEQTLFFHHRDGSWICISLTEEETPEAGARVLLTFVMDDVVISNYFYDTELRELMVPLVSAPEGRVFAGWYREEISPDGSTTLIPVFRPDETGLARFSEDFTLQPMTLYALFEDASTETEVND